MILFLLALSVFCCSLFIFFDLKHPLLWKISIVTTEYGQWVLVVPFACMVMARFQSPLDGMTTIVSMMSVAMLLWPSVTASIIAVDLPDRLQKAFGQTSTTESPFSWTRLWFPFPLKRKAIETFTYSSNDGQRLIFNFYRPHSAAPSPCVIVIHTGGWDSGSPDEFETMSHHLSSHGVAVAAISYRFAPQWKWPAQKEDTIAALQHIKSNAKTLNVDPDQFILLGRSAGGHIAEAVAYAVNDPAIRGCIALYAPADLNFAYEHLTPEPDILDSRTLLENFLGGSQEQVHSQYDDASPYNFVSRHSPPTLLLHGAHDPLTWFRQSERLSQRLQQCGIPHVYVELPWGTHAFDYNFYGPGGQISTFAIEWFLSSTVKPPHP